MNLRLNLGQITRVTIAAIGSASLLLSGCGSYNSQYNNQTGTTPVTGNTTSTPTVITDAANDQLLALGLTINTIRLYDASGKFTDVLTSPTTIEASHLDAVEEPLHAPLAIPQDTYTYAIITFSNPVVIYVNPTTKKASQATSTLTSTTDTVTFGTPIAVTTTSTPIVFDLLVGQSVTLNGSTASVTPAFKVKQITVSDHATNQQNGRLDDVRAAVMSTSSTSLTLQTPNGSQTVVNTDSSTQLQGFTALSSLTAGQLVDIDIAQQSSGGLLALRIHLDDQAATNELLGPVTAVTGTPVTSFAQTARQWLGSATTGATAGTAYTVTVTGSTTFATDAHFGTLPSLPFTPTFNASTLSLGQNVSVVASTVSGTSATATSVTLIPQTVGGTIASIAALSGGFSAYTVTLSTGSALGTLTGATSVVVYTNSNTQFMTATAIAVGSTVRFNGLLFNDVGTLRLLGGAVSDHEDASNSQQTPPPPY